MKTLLSFFLVLIALISCKKNTSDKPDPGTFYVRFKLNDSTVSYTNNADYYFWEDMGLSSSGSGLQFFPITYISPVADLHSNIGVYYSFAQVYSYLPPPCATCWGTSWAQYGDTIFAPGSRKYCNTGWTLVGGPFELACGTNNTTTLFITSNAGNLLNSGTHPQPAWSYYSIDTATDFHFRGTTPSSADYDKIISGRFACRVFNPIDTADHLDITEGEFRMPIWLNNTN